MKQFGVWDTGSVTDKINPGKRLFWQLYPSFLLIVLLSLVPLSYFALDTFRDKHLSQMKQSLYTQALILSRSLKEQINTKNYDAIREIIGELSKNQQSRLTIILPSGLVIADTHEDPANMDNHSDRPEIKVAMKGETGSSLRFSNTVKEEMLYVAVPFNDSQQNISGISRTALSVSVIYNQIGKLSIRITLAGIALASLAMLFSYWLTNRITSPIQVLREGADRFARGNFHPPIYISAAIEIESLANSLNTMSQTLFERLSRITQINSEQKAILSSMLEGVMAFDLEQRVIIINNAAAEMFRLPRGRHKGKKAAGLLRNSKLTAFLEELQVSVTPKEDDLDLRFNTEETRYIRLIGGPLKNEKGDVVGVLVVFNDITKMMKLENLRRDFVANVSHEMRTPLTSIKGYAETLINGALEDKESSKKFLQVIQRQSERLNSIVDDLLSLAKIEQEGDKPLEMQPSKIGRLLHSATEVCRQKARAKNIQINIICDKNLEATVNPGMIEQSVINLVDNAVKYSNENKNIWVQAQRNNGNLLISIKDEGMGIPPEHLPRLFERFYRVDKARSRNVGGTGLGLAIVKHIALAHHGDVEVKSKIGEGSEFLLNLKA